MNNQKTTTMENFKKEVFNIRTRYENDTIDSIVHIANETEELDRLINGDDIIIKNKKATIIVRYPIKDFVTFNISSKNEKGFTLKDVVENVSNIYKKIYKEELETTTEVEPKSNKGVNVLNRSRTNGKYGIWGHDIEDLVLESVLVYTKNDLVSIELGIES